MNLYSSQLYSESNMDTDMIELPSYDTQDSQPTLFLLHMYMYIIKIYEFD